MLGWILWGKVACLTKHRSEVTTECTDFSPPKHVSTAPTHQTNPPMGSGQGLGFGRVNYGNQVCVCGGGGGGGGGVQRKLNTSDHLAIVVSLDKCESDAVLKIL